MRPNLTFSQSNENMSQTFILDGKTSSSVVLTLFTNLQNPQEIRDNLKNGTVQFCAIRPQLIYDAFQVVVAANKAVAAEKLTTKTVYSEILFNLSFSKNITQSFQKFGLEEKGKNVLVAVIVQNDAVDEAKKLMDVVKGDVVDLGKLREFCDVNALKKAYKLSDCETKNSDVLLGSVVSRIAAKDLIL